MKYRNGSMPWVAMGLLATLLTGCASTDRRTVASPDDRVLIRGGWVFDGIRESRYPNSGIVIRGGRIIEVGADLTGRDFSGFEVIDLEGDVTILPGMIDLHAHYNFDLVDEGRAEEVTYNGIVFLANGVTSTWSAGEFFPDRVFDARDRINRGDAIGPRLFPSGPYFGAFRCEYQIETADDDCIGWPNDITDTEIRAEVDKWADRGVISIKIKQASLSEAEILIDQAHKRGMTTAGHLANYQWRYDVTAKDAIRMGIDRIEHEFTLDVGGEENSDLEAMIELFLENDVYYDANLQMYGEGKLRNDPSLDMVWVDEARFFTPYARTLLEKRRAANPGMESAQPADFPRRVVELGAFYRAGGARLLLVGTDEPVYGLLLPGFAYHRELQALVWAGLPPVVVLKAATINGARALGVADQLGSIEAGKLADLYIANGNPLEDIKAARDIRLVIKAGVVYEPETLLRSAEGKIGPAGPDDHDDWKLQIPPLRPQ